MPKQADKLQILGMTYTAIDMCKQRAQLKANLADHEKLKGNHGNENGCDPTWHVQQNSLLCTAAVKSTDPSVKCAEPSLTA